MCGSNRPLVSASIEGTTLQVCQSCASYGNVIPQSTPLPQQPSAQRARQRADAEMDELLVDNFAQLIKQAREHRGLQQKDLARAKTYQGRAVRQDRGRLLAIFLKK